MIGLGTATTQLDTSVNIAFPAITKGFDISISDIQWVVIRTTPVHSATGRWLRR
jgi:hypothetical protein